MADVLTSKKPVQPKVVSVVKTQEIDLNNITLPPKVVKATGTKKNIYLDQEAYDIVMKVQKTQGYNSFSETIQALIKAHKR